MAEDKVPPEIRQGLAEVQRRRGARIRWSVGRHTAEMAIAAIQQPPRPGKARPRRRRRHKRFL
jgi:hypothetical protein